MAIQTFSNFSADAQTYIAAQTLLRIKRDVIVYGLGKKEKLPNRFSKTFQFTRYDKLNLPKVALTEGTTPSTNASITISTVQAVMDQWGDFVNISDVADLTVKHPVMEQAIQLLSEQASETIDREVIKVILANTSVYYPGVVSSRGGLASNSYFDTRYSSQNNCSSSWSRRAALRGSYVHGSHRPLRRDADLSKDSTFQTATSYSNILVLQNGEAGRWMGVRWVTSNLLPVLERLASVVTATSVAAGGSLANSTTYYMKVTAVDNAIGFETRGKCVSKHRRLVLATKLSRSQCLRLRATHTMCTSETLLAFCTEGCFAPRSISGCNRLRFLLLATHLRQLQRLVSRSTSRGFLVKKLSQYRN